MRLAFDTACQRPEGWSRSRQPDRRIISGIRSKTLLRPATDGEYRQKGFAAPCVKRDTSQNAVYQKDFTFYPPFTSNTKLRLGLVTIKSFDSLGIAKRTGQSDDYSSWVTLFDYLIIWSQKKSKIYIYVDILRKVLLLYIVAMNFYKLFG